MKSNTFYFICVILCWLGLSTAQGSIVFDLRNPNSTTGNHPSLPNYAYRYNYSVDGLGLEVTGWTDDSGIPGIAQNYVGKWSGGLGIEVASSPLHAIDNYDGYEMVLACFDQTVSLDTFSIGWKYHDSDVSVLALTDGSFPGTFSSDDNWADLLSQDWESAGNYANVPVGTPVEIVPDLTAQYWLVGAYNESLGGPNYGVKLGEGKPDKFKLKKVEVTPTPVVPVPSSMLLACAGLVLIQRFRKKMI